jgi:hypothetical protein
MHGRLHNMPVKSFMKKSVRKKHTKKSVFLIKEGIASVNCIACVVSLKTLCNEKKRLNT